MKTESNVSLTIKGSALRSLEILERNWKHVGLNATAEIAFFSNISPPPLVEKQANMRIKVAYLIR